MDLELAACCVEVAKTNSISKASKNLNVTQPALSKKIKYLEEYLGVTLFRRNAKGVEITEEGSYFLENIKSILEGFEQLKYEVKNLSNVRYVSLGSLSSVATYFLPDKLMELEKDNTKVDLHISNITIELINQYKQGKLNTLIIESDYKSELEDSYEEILFIEKMQVIMPTNHHLAKKEKLSLQDIKHEPFILYPKDCPIHKLIKTHFQKNSISPLISTEISFSESILSLVASGKGITLLPEIIVKNNHSFNVSVAELDLPIYRSISLFSKSTNLQNYLASCFK